jgi:hypothetical protein
MSKGEGEVREIPFLGNDMKDHAATTGKPVNQADAPGKADSEWNEGADPENSRGTDDALLDDSPGNLT